MSRSFWAAVGAGGLVLTLGLVAALAASHSAPVRSASTHATPSHPVPIVHHIAVVHTPPLAHNPKPRAARRARHAARPALTARRSVTQRRSLTARRAVTPRRAVLARRLVVLAPGSGYPQADGSAPVRALQRRLTGLGFAPGPVDGRYGPRTTLAVERFQTARGLSVDGIMGARSFAALDAIPRSGLAPGTGTVQPSQPVRLLQRRLTRLGFTPGPVDGRYGPLTTRAVERFQHARRLTVNGIVDARTQRALRPVTRPARTTRPANHPAHPHPAAQPQPAPEGNPARVSPAHHQPGLPVTLVLLALAALGLATILLSYRRTRVRARHQPAHGEHTSTRVPELITTHDTNPGEREEQR
jgi:peptidoglycan hydrolase-like protein with peptidoglycan-binding domain